LSTPEQERTTSATRSPKRLRISESRGLPVFLPRGRQQCCFSHCSAVEIQHTVFCVLRVACTKCERVGRYRVDRLIKDCSRDVKIFKPRRMQTHPTC
jgi:hypothetical protein